MSRISAGNFSINFKPVLAILILGMIVYTPGYFISTGYANNSAGQVTLEAVKPVTHTPAEKAGSQPDEQWQIVQFRVTAYCPCPKCCGQYSDGITASGHIINTGDRFVAADKNLSFGTEMIIPGYNNSQPVKVLDRGGAIKGHKLDVFFNSHSEALEWGVKYLDVKILMQDRIN